MNAHGTAQGNQTGTASELYVAFELGEKNWKLSLGDGVRGPSRHTVTAGDSLASLAYREYGDPALWRALARYNGIDDPIRVARAMRREVSRGPSPRVP